MPQKEKWKVELIPLPKGQESIPPPNFGRLDLDKLGLKWLEVKTKVKKDPPVPKIEYTTPKINIEEEESETSLVASNDTDYEDESEQSLSDVPKRRSKHKKKHKLKKISALSTKYKKLRKSAITIDSSSSSDGGLSSESGYQTDEDEDSSSYEEEESESDYEDEEEFEIVDEDDSESDEEKKSRSTSSKPRIRLEKPRKRKSDNSEDESAPPDLKEYLAKWYILKRKFPHKADEMPIFTEKDSAEVVKKEWERWARILGIEAFVEDNTGYAKLAFVVMELATVYYFGINEFKGFTKAQLRPSAMQKYERLLLEMGEERTTAQAISAPKWPAWIRLLVAILVASVAFWAESMIAKVGGDFLGNVINNAGRNNSNQGSSSQGDNRRPPPHSQTFQSQRSSPPPQRVMKPPNINLGV